MTLGTIVSLKLPLFGLPAGTPGVCYESYRFNGRMGFAIIFQTGYYDVLDATDAEDFLEEQGFSDQISQTFSFTDVLKLEHDFKHGYFDLVFKNQETVS